jgi:transcription antitermination factor NusG
MSNPWFALQVRGRYEDTIAKNLAGKGYECFHPVHKCRRRWSDRFKEVEQPLFPGYIFCRLNVIYRLPILTTPGVISIVGVAKIPVPVDETEIAAIRLAVNSGLPSGPWPFLQIGRKVRIDYGPLCGLEGILIDFKGATRLILSVTLLQRSVAVELENAWVTPLPPSVLQTPGPGNLSRRQ